MRFSSWVGLVGLMCLVVGCGDDASAADAGAVDSGRDVGIEPDASDDAGGTDSGGEDAEGVDAPVDAPSDTPMAELEAEPVSLDYGSVRVGTPHDLEVTIRNTGRATSTILGSSVSDEMPFFIPTATNGCSGATLDVDATCTVVVRFTPRTATAYSATFDVVEVDGGTATVSVPLTGTGIRSCSGSDCLIAAGPMPDFGRVAIGDSAELSTLFVNTGATTTGSLTASWAGATDITIAGCSGWILGEGESCAVRLTFTPTVSSPRSGQLTVSDGSVDARINGSGMGYEPRITVSPTSVSWTFLGTTPTFPVTEDLVVTAAATGPIPAIDVELMDTSNVTISVNTCTGVLGPSETCDIQLQWDPPTDVTPINTDGTLTITPMFGTPRVVDVQGLVI